MLAGGWAHFGDARCCSEGTGSIRQCWCCPRSLPQPNLLQINAGGTGAMSLGKKPSRWPSAWSGAEGRWTPAPVSVSSPAAASLLFHGSKGAENAPGSRTSFDAERVCERCRHPQGLASPSEGGTRAAPTHPCQAGLAPVQTERAELVQPFSFGGGGTRQTPPGT